jgi:hypothetical protein
MLSSPRAIIRSKNFWLAVHRSAALIFPHILHMSDQIQFGERGRLLLVRHLTVKIGRLRLPEAA